MVETRVVAAPVGGCVLNATGAGCTWLARDQGASGRVSLWWWSWGAVP